MRSNALTAYVLANIIVILSRFFSTIPVPEPVVGIDPPSIEERPVPLPECRSTKMIRPIELRTCTARTT